MHFKISTCIKSHIQVIVSCTQVVPRVIPVHWKAKWVPCANRLSITKPFDGRGWITSGIAKECHYLCLNNCLVSWGVDEPGWNYKKNNITCIFSEYLCYTCRVN